MIGTLARRQTIVAAVGAGLAGGCLMLVCLGGVNGLLANDPQWFGQFFSFVASVLVGKASVAAGGSIALGISVHFLVSIGWALGYAVAAQRQSQLLTRPIISGAAFGVIVYFAMQLVIVAASRYHIPKPGELGVALLAHTVFFGIPIALIMGRAKRLA